MAAKKISKKKACWWRHCLPSKFFRPIIFFIFLFFLLILVNLFFLFKIKRELSLDFSNVGQPADSLTSSNSESGFSGNLKLSNLGLSVIDYKNSALPLIANLSPLNPIDNNSVIVKRAASEQLLQGDLASFGDSFSGLAYLDEAQSDMFWDENVTAFTFPPVYQLEKQSECSVTDCNLSRENTDPQSICLAAGCLRKTVDLKLFFNNRELKLPPPLDEEILSSITLFSVGDAWLIGLVSGPATDERVWVYRFDGLAFSPLIGQNTELQIKPRFQRGGGRIAFGGTADDFLVIYAGYDGRAFRFRGENREDISKFFGLRVTDGGFWPQILKVGNGRDSIFYICSLSAGKPKILKIWSKDDLNSGGVFDFSPLLFRGDWRPDNILCGVSDADSKRLVVAAASDKAYSLWSFNDLGFDNSRIRRLTSFNLNSKTAKTVKAAVLADIGAIAYDSQAAPGLIFSLANSRDNFEEVFPFLWHGFQSEGKELFWRLEFKPSDNQYYSPWFEHLNRLDYLLSD